MEDWLRDELLRRGYDLVYTPHIMRLDLWKTSGHTDFYRDNMFGAVEVEKADYQLKPMNCPGHILIYKSKLRSYRELAGAPGGTRARCIATSVRACCTACCACADSRRTTRTSSACRRRSRAEVEACVDFAFAVMKTFGFSRYQVELSDWDASHPENYAGSAEDWKRATDALATTMDRMGIPYKRMEAEAAFYGPKIDVKLIDAIGRPWQLTTVQFDFNLPGRFGLEYVGEDGARHQPLMVHRALWGSVERFFGILIEHYAGAFPLWLAPVQVAVLPVSEKVAAYAAQVAARTQGRGHSRVSRRPQRKTGREDSRFGDAEGSVHGRGRRQRSGGAARSRCVTTARAIWGHGRWRSSWRICRPRWPRARCQRQRKRRHHDGSPFRFVFGDGADGAAQNRDFAFAGNSRTDP